MKLMGAQFVLGETIGRAMERARALEGKGYTYSYDMLGEAARTDPDALRYAAAYARAIAAIGARATGRGGGEPGDLGQALGAASALRVDAPRAR